VSERQIVRRSYPLFMAELRIKMKKITPNETRIVIIPDHPEIPAGTLKSIIRQAGMTDEEFIKLL